MTDDLPNDPGAVIVRRYGLRPPLDWGKDCDDEMSRMTDLWNALVAIERDHWRRFGGSMVGFGLRPRIDHLRATMSQETALIPAEKTSFLPADCRSKIPDKSSKQALTGRAIGPIFVSSKTE